MDKQAEFVAWLRDQLQPSGAEFTISTFNHETGESEEATVVEIDPYERGGIDSIRIIFDDGDAIEVSVGPDMAEE